MPRAAATRVRAAVSMVRTGRLLPERITNTVRHVHNTVKARGGGGGWPRGARPATPARGSAGPVRAHRAAAATGPSAARADLEQWNRRSQPRFPE
ncbi:hypothetical protein GCM10027174_32980 [Salinifilum aidingensis]